MRTATLSDAPLPALQHPVPPWPGETVALEGARVHVRRTPAGSADAEPALYVHGLGGSATNWTDLAALLRDRLDAEAIDLPGFGHSDPAVGGRYGLAAHVRAVTDLLDARGRGPVHLFGNSLGGAVCVRVAATRPDLVRTLTLVSPAMPDFRPRRGSDPLIPLLLVPGLSALANRRLARLTPERRARAVIEMCFAHPEQVPPERLAEYADEVRRRSTLPWTQRAFTASLRGLVAAYLEPGPNALWQQVTRIAAPTLVVWGSADRLVDVALAPRVAGAVPDARLLVLDDVGHTAQLERPETVARAFLGLLAELDPSV